MNPVVKLMFKSEKYFSCHKLLWECRNTVFKFQKQFNYIKYASVTFIDPLEKIK